MSCTGGARKIKAGLERDIKVNNKRFYKYINCKKTRENVVVLLVAARKLVTHYLEKFKMLNAAFVLVYTSKNGFQESQPLAVQLE